MKLTQVFVIILALNLFTFSNAYSTHVFGGEITWECVGQDSFIINVAVYRDCNGIGLWRAPIVIKCASTGSVIVRDTANLPTPTDITPVCDQYCSRCESRCRPR